jgi:hypothetical protein
MTGSTGVEGEFWTPENPGFRVRGEFTAEIGERPAANLVNNLVPDPRVMVHASGFAVSAEATRSVASFRPIVLHGRLVTGEPLTLLNAQNWGAAGAFAPYYRSSVAVLGGHVAGDQRYSAVRFRMDRRYWLAHLSDGESSEVEDDRSVLTVQELDGENWLLYESSTPVTLRQLEVRVLSGCLALLQLALHPDEDRTIRETHVRVDSGSPWLAVHGDAFRSDEGEVEHEPLLKPDQLTIERYAKWIALHTLLDGLTWVVARRLKGAVNARVMLLTTILEGFHRSLDNYEKRKFPSVDPVALRRILEAMRAAAVAQALEEGLDQSFLETAEGQHQSIVEKAVTFHTAVSYQDRAQAIVAEVCSVVPEIVESISEFPRRLTKVRNDFAHPSWGGKSQPLEERVLEWTVVSEATSWLLRCLLLLRVGIGSDVLQQRLLWFQRFQFFRANTAQHVSELGWELPAPD